MRGAVAASLSRSLESARVSLRTRAQFSSRGLPEYEAQPLGGDGSVRGYEADELGKGGTSLVGTLTLTFPVPPPPGEKQGPPVSFNLFADAGVRPRDPWSANSDEARAASSAGACAGYGLRFGPIKFDVAYNILGARAVHVGLAGADGV